jgi:hypothetical protein
MEAKLTKSQILELFEDRKVMFAFSNKWSKNGFEHHEYNKNEADEILKSRTYLTHTFCGITIVLID